MVARASAALAVGAVVTVAAATDAFANAANPIAPAELGPGSVVQNANGTVTVTATGTWIWPHGEETDTTQGLDATVQHPCDHRTGVGWGVVWNDPDDPGFTETYRTKAGILLTQTVHVGSQGVNPLNADRSVQYNTTDPCGQFVQNNQPAEGDGYDTGTWTSTHVYNSLADVPRSICVITYDLGVSKPPGKHRLNFDNNDNSVQWGLYSGGYWNTTTMGKNCSTTPPAVPASATQPVVTVSHPSTSVAPVSKPSTSLAFTGFGSSGLTTALLGVIFLVLGLVVYFVDPRRIVRRLRFADPRRVVNPRRLEEARRLGHWLTGR